MKSFKSIQPRLKVDPITIKEPYKPDVKEFADTEEFTRYFRSNEELFKEPRTGNAARTCGAADEDTEPHFLTTNKLNRTYKIPGYRIRIINKGKDNEELTLVKDYYTRIIESNQETIIDTDNDANNERITQLEELVQRITEQINNIETFLLQLKRWIIHIFRYRNELYD